MRYMESNRPRRLTDESSKQNNTTVQASSIRRPQQLDAMKVRQESVSQYQSTLMGDTVESPFKIQKNHSLVA